MNRDLSLRNTYKFKFHAPLNQPHESVRALVCIKIVVWIVPYISMCGESLLLK